MTRMGVIKICTVMLSLCCVLAATDPSVVQDIANDFLMVFTSVNVTVRQKEVHDVMSSTAFTATAAPATINPNGSDSVEVTLSFPKGQKQGSLTVELFDLSMLFTKDIGGYWTMKGATANLKGSDVANFNFPNVVLMSEIDLTAPQGLSFHCSRFGPLYPNRPEGNHTFYIDVRGFQVQPFANSTSFQESYECVGFFTIGILSGLFVTLILISVLTWGLAMIMSVKTMDRFDDPKGKPISFGGTE